jgi:peptide chain release factor subunit 1
MALRDELKHLAKLPRTSSPFLSLYLNTRWDSEKQRERVRIFVKGQLKSCLAGSGKLDPSARKGMEEDAEKVEHYVRGLVNREWDESYDGVAVFACSALGEYRVIRSHAPFEQHFTCADRPMLRPAAEQAHAGQAAVLALVSGDGGRLLEFSLGGVTREFSFVDEEFPGRHDQGGWSQARYQRHVEEHLARNLKRLAEHLTKWVDERRIDRVVLSGPDPLLGTFETLLPKRVADAVCDRLHLDPSLASDAVLAETLSALDAARRRDDGQAVDGLLDSGRKAGRVAVGPEPVAQAVSGGKVHVLYLESAFRESGWKCFHCGALGIKVPLGCPRCAKAVEGVELGEEFVRGTLATDGRVVAVDGHDGLRAEGGAGAVLRYA